ncbi:HNH endonuclease signature motif containing protein [Christiangramia forsetii]|uniref:HNH nuclease domain-containing protein n=2 Tax=Christiangramia forsetii TaxID=411153 RepID=A0M466_CHRFK|nr:HNH endonuclease signature motif containing protein [Christiangramia forsetii]GGG24116.1 hypothetical protein GCM10011532_04190 [Christiangramia forsetii]CAL67411.1 hypothetical protein GFO_2455 [Christiangramia forsetii KT0803]
MKPYTKLYFRALGYAESDFIPSEISGNRAVDINHIICKGSGGNPSGDKDRIENLMALTREEHIEQGDKKHLIADQFRTHARLLEANGVKFDKIWIHEQIQKYSQYEASSAELIKGH